MSEPTVMTKGNNSKSDIRPEGRISKSDHEKAGIGIPPSQKELEFRRPKKDAGHFSVSGVYGGSCEIRTRGTVARTSV